MRPPASKGRGFGGARGRGGGKGGRGFGKGRGGRGPEGPPDSVEPVGTLMHDCEGDLVCKLTHADGRSVVCNVEYNQLEPLLLASGHAAGDVNDASSGFSPYPGSINGLMFDLVQYAATLAATGGAEYCRLDKLQEHLRALGKEFDEDCARDD